MTSKSSSRIQQYVMASKTHHDANKFSMVYRQKHRHKSNRIRHDVKMFVITSKMYSKRQKSLSRHQKHVILKHREFYEYISQF